MKYFILFLLFAVISYSCNSDSRIKNKFSTNSEFICKYFVSKADYLDDSLYFINKLQHYIQRKESPYNAPAYNEKTIVYIDTIIYNSDKNQAAVFVIMKCYGETSKEWSYDGVTHFAGQVKDSLGNNEGWEIYANHGVRHILAETYDKMSETLRVQNFVYRRYEAHEKNPEGYNVDDCRFWKSDSFINEIQAEGFVKL